MTDYSYIDKLRNQKLKFIPKEDNIIVEFSLSQKNNSEEWSHGLLPIDKAPLKLSEKIEKAIPILVDEDQLERYFLPDECTVQFKEEIGETEIDKIIEYCQCSILIKHCTLNF